MMGWSNPLFSRTTQGECV